MGKGAYYEVTEGLLMTHVPSYGDRSCSKAASSVDVACFLRPPSPQSSSELLELTPPWTCIGRTATMSPLSCPLLHPGLTGPSCGLADFLEIGPISGSHTVVDCHQQYYDIMVACKGGRRDGCDTAQRDR